MDNLGTVRDLAKQDGTIAVHYKYDSYGNVTSGDTSKTRYLFTGREFDTAIDLQYNRARWYDPEVGRWISEDPLSFAAGDANVARYVGNEVTGAIDPSGLDDLPKLPPGTPANGFHGTGQWVFTNFDEMWRFFRVIGRANEWPWPLTAPNMEQLERGCVGLAMFRLGFFLSAKDGGKDFPYDIDGSVIFDAIAPAIDYYRRHRPRQPGDPEVLLVAMQLPGNPVVQRQDGRERIDPHQLFIDEIQEDQQTKTAPGVVYNFGTYWDLGNGDGYWEYMLHSFQWDRINFPKEPPFPTVRHGNLPGRVGDFPYRDFFIIAPVKRVEESK